MGQFHRTSPNSATPSPHILGGHDYSVPENDLAGVPTRLSISTNYHSTTASNLRLLFLDTNDISTYAHPPGSPAHTTTQDRLTKLRKEKKPNAHPWNGAGSKTRLKWLYSECTKTENSAQHVVVSTHHPVYPSGSHNFWNTPEILPVIDRHSNIVAWFNGHNHAGTYALRNGVHYATLHGMVETADTNASAIASFSDGALSIQGAGWEPSRTLSFPS